jgi:hypothetical protein
MILLQQFFFYSFLSVQEILPLTNFCLPSTNKFSPMLEEERQLAPSPLISTNLFSLLHVLDPKEIPTRRNFGFLVIFSRNHSPKILLTFFDIDLLRASFL